MTEKAYGLVTTSLKELTSLRAEAVADVNKFLVDMEPGVWEHDAEIRRTLILRLQILADIANEIKYYEDR